MPETAKPADELPPPDLSRMRLDRRARLAAEMARRDLEAVLLMGSGAVQYAVGHHRPVVDASHASYERCAALLLAGDELPHLFTAFPEGCPPELRSDHCHPPLHPWTGAGIEELATVVAELAGRRLTGTVALDGATAVLHLALGSVLGGVKVVDAAEVVGAAKLVKTEDEVACIALAQRVNELAIYDVERLLRPGVRQSELTGTFLRRIFELGATGNWVDPIWQVMPSARSEGPFATNGEVAFPLCATDALLSEGDVVWVDTGVDYHGYASDFGTTWTVGRQAWPAPRRRQLERWQDVVAATLAEVRPGATGADLTRAACAANGGDRPWLQHFYLAHGIGTSSAEMPLIGTDLGQAFDESIVLAPGIVLVLEPVVWDEGSAGYRGEEVVVVTDSGYRRLGGYRHGSGGP